MANTAGQTGKQYGSGDTADQNLGNRANRGVPNLLYKVAEKRVAKIRAPGKKAAQAPSPFSVPLRTIGSKD
jgi:hypothetical protein